MRGVRWDVIKCRMDVITGYGAERVWFDGRMRGEIVGFDEGLWGITRSGGWETGQGRVFLLVQTG